jgi:hypothetical protein
MSYTYDCFTGFLVTFSNVLIVLLYIGLFTRSRFIVSEYSFWMLTDGIAYIGLRAIIWRFGITYIISKTKNGLISIVFGC